VSLLGTIQTLFEVFFGSFIASIIGYFTTPDYRAFWINSMSFFGSLTAIIILLWLFHEPVEYNIWKIRKKIMLINPVVGILEEENVLPHFTRISPDTWKTELEKNGLKVKYVRTNEISGRFVLILNPYGETYPEEELIETETFKKIKKYIYGGGIFVNVSGLAFYYGYDFKRRNDPPLAQESKTFLPQTHCGQNVIVEQSVYPPVGYSLTDTMLYNHFKILTTWEPEAVRQVTQNDESKKIIGDIENVGNTNSVYEFRAVRKETRKWLSFLTASSQVGDVYPIAGIPYGKGCLILCGFNLDVDVNSPIWNPQIHQGCILKIIHMIVNIVNYRKNGQIPLDSSHW